MPFIAPDEFMIDPMDHDQNNDGRCRCDRCQEFRKKHPCKDDTEIIWQVIGEIADHVAKKYPGCYISTLVYPPKKSIPRLTKPTRNIRVRICLTGARSLIFPDQMAFEMKLLKEWGAFLGPKNIPLWVYQCTADFGRFLPGCGFSSWVQRPLGGGNGSLLQYSCLKNPMDREAWQATVYGVARLGRDRVTKHTSTHMT